MGTANVTETPASAGNTISKLIAAGNVPATPATEEDELEVCWQDERDREFNVEIHHMLIDAGDEIDSDGTALESVTRALGVVDEIRARLIAEQAFRQDTAPAAVTTPNWDSASSQLIELQAQILQARGIIGMASTPATEEDEDKEFALRAAYNILDDLFDRMDPVTFARESQEVQP